jgi:iron(III) transport system substrate-binding protein
VIARLTFALPAAAAAALALAACDGGSAAERVVLYVSADTHVARPVIEAFEDRTGLRVDVVPDTEAQKTTALARRLEDERDRPVADVFWSSEIFRTIRLAEGGVLAPLDVEAVRERPAEYVDPGGRWAGFAGRARVIVYAPSRVAPQDVPATWMDLTSPRFRGRIAMADPRFGTTGGHLAAMKSWWDSHVMAMYYEAFLEGLAANDVLLLPGGNAAVVDAVAEGRADVGLTDTDDVWAAQARGLGVALVYPRHDVGDGSGRGTLVIPNTVALVAGGPNPQGGRRLVEFLLSREVERMLAESGSRNVPLRGDLAAEFAGQAVPDPLRVDYAAAAAVLDEAVEEAMALLGESAE